MTVALLLLICECQAKSWSELGATLMRWRAAQHAHGCDWRFARTENTVSTKTAFTALNRSVLLAIPRSLPS